MVDHWFKPGLQLGEHVARDLGLRFRASPPHSHQSNGAVERLHGTLFDKLRAVRLQRALSLGIQPERLPQQALPWLLQHSVFILNKYLVKDTGTTAHQNNYHKPYNNPMSLRRSSLSRHSLLGRLQSETEKPRPKEGLWIGKDPTTDEHLIALPPVYDNHPSATGAIYKCRGVTRLPQPNMWETTFLATIQWPPMESMDYIEPDVSENYKYLQQHNTSTREQLAQQPQQFQPAQEQPQQRAQRREVLQPKQPPVPQLEPLGTTTKAVLLRPPPGLEHVPAQPPDYLVLLRKHRLVHHHHSQYDHSLLLDHHNMGRLASTTILYDKDHNHNKLELSYLNLLFHNKLTWTTTLTPTTATTSPWRPMYCT